MKIEFTVNGSDEIIKHLERMRKNIKNIEGSHIVRADELLTPDFLRKHCKYFSFEQLVGSSGLIDEKEEITKERFESIPEEKWDNWIKRATDFSNWKEMVSVAMKEYADKKLCERIR